MSKKKLKRFSELATFSNVFQLPFNELNSTDFILKGKWTEEYFSAKSGSVYPSSGVASGGNNKNPIVLELGCGKGEYTLGLAGKFPRKNFIGIDLKGARIWKGCKNADEKNLKNVVFIRTHAERLASIFAPAEIDEIWITFPDPYPKNSNANKRLTSSRFLDIYKKILRPGGFLHLKTDNRILYDFTIKTVKNHGGIIHSATSDLYSENKPACPAGRQDENLSIQTHYEKIFLGQGLPICYLRFSI